MSGYVKGDGSPADVPPDTYDPADLESVLETYEMIKAQHLNTRCRQKALEIIRTNRPHNGRGITAAVILATGEF